MTALLKRMKTHDRCMEKSSNVPKPKEFTKDNKNPNPTPHQDFLEEYVRMAPLNGDASNEDRKQVLGLLNKFIVGNNQAEGVVKPLNTTTDGRGAFLAVKHKFEGQGLMMNRLTLAKKTFDTLFYKSETQFRHWKKFESELINAYALVDKLSEAQQYDDAAKLRTLQQLQI